MKIQVKVKNVYGNEMIYPVCASAQAFAELARQKTLTHRELMVIKRLGYTIEVVQDVVKL